MRVLLIGLLLWGCKKPVSGPPGKAYYEALNCRACHRIGEDGGMAAPDLTTVGLRHSRQWLDLWLKDPQAWRPGTTMPSPNLPDKVRDAVAGYLADLKGQDFGGEPPWAKASGVERGRMIFERAGCVGCHGKAGSGGHPNNNVKGGVIPRLAGVAQTYTKAELVKKIARGVRPEKADPAGAEPLVEMPSWGELLKPEDIDAVADYLLSLKPAAKSDAGF